MSALFENELPTGLDYGGRSYPIHTDFREWLRFEELLTDRDMPDRDKTMLMRDLIFPESPPCPLPDLLEWIMWFYRCGKPRREVKQGSKAAPVCYSGEYDDDLILAAFMQVYGIDLSQISYMHWWKFHALFNGLPEGTKLGTVMGYRVMEIDKDMSAERKKQISEMKKIYALPKPLSEIQRIEAAKRQKEAYQRGR